MKYAVLPLLFLFSACGSADIICGVVIETWPSDLSTYSALVQVRKETRTVDITEAEFAVTMTGDSICGALRSTEHASRGWGSLSE